MPLPLALVIVLISALLHYFVFTPQLLKKDLDPAETPWQILGWGVAILLNFVLAMVVFVRSMF